MFLLSGLWNILIMGDFAREHGPTIMRETPYMSFIVLAYLVLATLLTVLYRASRFKGSAVAKGAKCGILAGLLWMLPSSLMLYALLEYSILPVVVDSAWAVVEVGIGGIIVGVVANTAAATASEQEPLVRSATTGFSRG